MEVLIEVVHRGGVHLPELDLWLDPHGAREWAFVSHAHFDHFAKHERSLCSDVSANLVARRFRVAKSRVEAHAFGQTWRERGFEFRLLPAGHIFGSAMIHLTRLNDGATLLYTGDFKVRHGLAAEAVEFLQADTLIMETTFGLPHYVFPPEEEIQASIVHFVRSALDDGEIPVLLGYSLGKAQEAIALLAREEIPCVQHKTVAAMTEVCRLSGLGLPPSVTFETTVPEGHALVCPPNAVRSKALRRMKNRRVAMLTGWALNANARYRYLTDAAFPLSDHADFPGLIEAVERVRPKRVLTLHGSAREFATELRSRGWDAWSVFGNDQLELSMEPTSHEEGRHEHARPHCQLREFTGLCEAVEQSPGRLEKIRLLVRYLGGLRDEDLKLAATWLAGRVFGRAHRHRSLKVGPALIRQALLDASGLPLARYKAISATQNESARTARLMLEEARPDPCPMSLLDLAGVLEKLASSEGSLERVDILARLFRGLHPAESASVVKIITGGLRMGSKEGLMEDAVADAFEAKPAEVRDAHMRLGDLGEVALLAREGGLDRAQLKPLVPVLPMLASPEPDAEAIWARLGAGGSAWLEDKFDGIRAQIHKVGEETGIFSRDLRSLDGEFPELLEQIRSLDDDLILDGEIIAHAEGRKLGFFDLQKRLGRTKGQGDLFLGAAVPVRFVVFDVLYAKGRDLLRQPLAVRRLELESIQLPASFERIEVTQADSMAAVEAAFKVSSKAGNEGLIAKDPDSHYLPGRRGKAWLKLKHVMPTLDCIVIKAQQGHGRRAEVLSDYTFALKDGASGRLVTVGKAYTGLTDEEIEELTEHFKQRTLSVSRRVHTVEPDVVLEIAFDSIRRSKRHDSGLAMRFPRIKAIRRDKSIDDIDSLSYAESLIDG